MAQHPLPHHYPATAVVPDDGPVTVSSTNVADFITAPPPEFGGPGDQWSPETLLSATVASCFILTFRSVARAMELLWDEVTCHCDGVLERVDKELIFTEFNLKAELKVPEGEPEDQCVKAMEKAEKICLITNSLSAKINLETHVQVG